MFLNLISKMALERETTSQTDSNNNIDGRTFNSNNNFNVGLTT